MSIELLVITRFLPIENDFNIMNKQSILYVYHVCISLYRNPFLTHLNYCKLTNIIARSEALLTILHIFNKSRRKPEPLGEIIKNIKNGDPELRNKFINDYNPFIIKVVSKNIGKYVDLENSEEYSIGLLAFNEAIDCFDEGKNAGFLGFAETVIKRRLIDFKRKNSKYGKTFPLSYFERYDEEENVSYENKFFTVDASSQFNNIEAKEELADFVKRLASFNIELKDLIKVAPKHMDSKRLAIKIARILAESKELSDKLERKKTIPMVELMKLLDVNHKTVERNRKFIISVYIILCSRLETLQSYIENVERG